MVHTFEEVRACTPANPYEATPEAIMPQAAWEAPPTSPTPSANGSRQPTPRPGPSAPPTHPTTTTLGRERARARRGQGTERHNQTKRHGRAPSEGQAPIGTGHRKRHNVGAGNHPRTRRGQERGPRRRERGHHGGRQDPHQGKAYHDGGTSAASPPADAARLPGAHTPNARRPSTNQTPYGSHQRTPTSHQEPHSG